MPLTLDDFDNTGISNQDKNILLASSNPAIGNLYKYYWEGYWHAVPVGFGGSSAFVFASMNVPAGPLRSIVGSTKVIYVNTLPATTRVFSSLQSMVEMQFVVAGNDILVENMSKLNSSLILARSVLYVLNELQRYRNLLAKVYPLDQFVYPTDTNLSNYQANFRIAASAFFNKFRGITYNLDNGFAVNYAASILSLKNTLTTLLTNPLLSPGGVSSSVKDAATKVSAEISIGGTGDTNGFLKWLLDGYSTVALGSDSGAVNNPTSNFIDNAGKIQSDLTAAITAAQSMNTDTTNQVQAYLFTFEQFYKSAAALLNNFTDIIKKMASNISR